MDPDGRRFLFTTIEDCLDFHLPGASFTKEEFLCLFAEGLDVDLLARSLLTYEEVIGDEITSCLGLFNDKSHGSIWCASLHIYISQRGFSCIRV